MYRGSNLLLPKFVIACAGRFLVDNNTLSPTLNEYSSFLPTRSLYSFCMSCAFAILSRISFIVDNLVSTKSSAVLLW